MILVRITTLPPDSALAIDANGGKRPWTISEYLLADLWEVQANRGLKKGRKPRQHPARPVMKPTEKRSAADIAARRKKFQAQARRIRQLERGGDR